MAFVNYAGGEFQVATDIRGGGQRRQKLLAQATSQGPKNVTRGKGKRFAGAEVAIALASTSTVPMGLPFPAACSHTGITDMRAGCKPKGTVAGVQGWFSLLYLTSSGGEP
jgi:hypothetical protein